MDTQLATVLKQKRRAIEMIGPEETVLEATRKMSQQKIGALLVVEQNQPVGIFSERDVLNRVVAQGLNPARTKVAEIMTTNVAVLQPTHTVQQAFVVCTEKRCRHLPVMDGDEVLGIVSSGDLIHWISRSQQFEIENLVRYITGQYPA